MSGNGTNDSLSNETTMDDLFVVTVWTLMLVYALVANVLVQIGICRSPSLRNSTSYWLILSLSLCDVLMILISLFHIVPATALHDRFVAVMNWRNVWAIFFYDLFWYTGVLKLGLMAVNRFISIVYPTHYARVFSRQRTLQIIAGVYLLGLLVSVPTLFPCCHTVWNHHFYVTVYEPEDTPYFLVDIAVNTISLVLMIFSYSVIINKVRSSRQALSRYRSTMKRISADATVSNGAAHYAAIPSQPPRAAISRREMRLFLQFFIVSMVFLGTWVTWQWLPRIHASKWIYFSMTSLFFINNGVNPTVYLIFNTTLRREVSRVLHMERFVRMRPGRAESHASSAFENERERRNKGSGETSSTSKQERAASPPQAKQNGGVPAAVVVSSGYVSGHASSKTLRSSPSKHGLPQTPSNEGLETIAALSRGLEHILPIDATPEPSPAATSVLVRKAVVPAVTREILDTTASTLLDESFSPSPKLHRMRRSVTMDSARRLILRRSVGIGPEPPPLLVDTGTSPDSSLSLSTEVGPLTSEALSPRSSSPPISLKDIGDLEKSLSAEDIQVITSTV